MGDKIQTLCALTAVLICSVTTFDILQQNAYAVTLTYNTDSNLSGTITTGIARSASHIWVTGNEGSKAFIYLFGPTGTFVTKKDVSTVCYPFLARGNDVIATTYGADDAMLTTCQLKAGGKVSIITYSYSASVITARGNIIPAPCSSINDRLNYSYQADLITWTCRLENAVGNYVPSTFTVPHQIVLTDCDKPNSSVEYSNAMIVYCSGTGTINLYKSSPSSATVTRLASYTLPGGGYAFDDMDCSIDLGRCLVSSKTTSQGGFVLQWNGNPSMTSGNITAFGGVGANVQNAGVFASDQSSAGSIALMGTFDHRIAIVGFNRTATVAPSLLTTIGLGTTERALNIAGPSIFYSGNNAIYYAATNNHNYAILNITGLTQPVNNDDDFNGGTGSNITGGGGGGGGGAGGVPGHGDDSDSSVPTDINCDLRGTGQPTHYSNATNYKCKTTEGNTTTYYICNDANQDGSLDHCYVYQFVNDTLYRTGCGFGLTDCTNPDIKTNGMGMLGMLLMGTFFAGLLFTASRKTGHSIGEIHPVFWIFIALATAGAAWLLGWVDSLVFFALIVVAAGIGGFAIYRKTRGGGGD